MFLNQLFVLMQSAEEDHVGRLGSLAYNSFRWRAMRLLIREAKKLCLLPKKIYTILYKIRFFNAMPKYIRCISSCSVVSFKSKFDCYLKNIAFSWPLRRPDCC